VNGYTHLYGKSVEQKEMHRQVMTRVNACVDEGIAPLIEALSSIDGLETIESCQGNPEASQSAFVVFRLGDWRRCAELLYGELLPAMAPDLRAAVSLRLEAYDTDTARAWIVLDPSAIPQMRDCVRNLTK
jgi:hypothetical protein